MKDLGVAQKYARALFAQAQVKNELSSCRQGLEEFDRVARWRGSLRAILSHPFVAPDEKKGLIRAVLGASASPLLERFLYLVITKHRLDIIFSITQEFQAEVDRFENVQALNVRTAFPMSEPQRNDLQGKLESWLKSKVRMEIQVDPDLIGGLVIQTRDHVLDQSLKGQLQKLRHQLTA